MKLTVVKCIWCKHDQDFIPLHACVKCSPYHVDMECTFVRKQVFPAEKAQTVEPKSRW